MMELITRTTIYATALLSWSSKIQVTILRFNKLVIPTLDGTMDLKSGAI